MCVSWSVAVSLSVCLYGCVSVPPRVCVCVCFCVCICVFMWMHLCVYASGGAYSLYVCASAMCVVCGHMRMCVCIYCAKILITTRTYTWADCQMQNWPWKSHVSISMSFISKCMRPDSLYMNVHDYEMPSLTNESRQDGGLLGSVALYIRKGDSHIHAHTHRSPVFLGENFCASEIMHKIHAHKSPIDVQKSPYIRKRAYNILRGSLFSRKKESCMRTEKYLNTQVSGDKQGSRVRQSSIYT